MRDVSFTGGANIGWLNASWPFAKLECNVRTLRISCFGSYEFMPQQVVSIEKTGFIPILASGVKIIHNRLDCPEKIVFWYLGGGQEVMDSIRATGFVPSGSTVARPKGIAFRWISLIALAILWNLLLFADNGWNFPPQRGGIGPYGVCALLMLFGLSIAIPKSPFFEGIFIKPGRSISEVIPVLRLVSIISGLMLAIMGMLYLTDMLAT